MNRILLSLALAGAGCLAAAAEEASEDVNFSIVVDDASHYVVTDCYFSKKDFKNHEDPVELADGENKFTLDGDHSLKILAAEGYFITSCTLGSTGGAYDVNDKVRSTVFVSQTEEGEVFTFTSKLISECRTAKVSVTVDHPEKVIMQRNGLSEYLHFSEEQPQEVWYDPADETPFVFSALNYGEGIYDVATTGGSAYGQYEKFYVAPEDGAEVSVVTEFPTDQDVTYTIESNLGTFDFLTVTTGNPQQTLDISSGSFTVKAGDRVYYNFDIDNYRIDGMEVDGRDMGNVYSFDFRARKDATHSFTVTKFEEFPVRIHCDDINGIVVRKGSLYNPIEEPADGVVTVMLKEPRDVLVLIQPASGYYIKGVKRGEDRTPIAYQFNFVSITTYEENDYYIDVDLVVYDHQTALYVDDIDAIQYFSSASNFNSANVFPNPQSGYNVYDVSLVCSPSNISGYNKLTNSWVNQIYLSHEKLEPASAYSAAVPVAFQGEDVIHVFTGEVPEMGTVSFEVEDGLEIDGVHNKVVPLHGILDYFEIFQGDEVSFSVESDAAEVEVTVNDEKLEAGAHGVYTFNTAAAETLVKVSAPSGVARIEAETPGDGAVYDLHGVRVDERRLAPGVYIKAGRKVVIK